MGAWIDFAAIKARVPLLRVPEHYEMAASLRRSGRDHYRGRCPLHQGEGREAFHVDTAQQLFHCFSCGAGGTVLDLVASVERCGVRHPYLRARGIAEQTAAAFGIGFYGGPGLLQLRLVIPIHNERGQLVAYCG